MVEQLLLEDYSVIAPLLDYLKEGNDLGDTGKYNMLRGAIGRYYNKLKDSQTEEDHSLQFRTFRRTKSWFRRDIQVIFAMDLYPLDTIIAEIVKVEKLVHDNSLKDRMILSLRENINELTLNISEL